MMLRVMSSNIRCSDARGDGENHWIHRKGIWLATIRAFGADLLGIQEVCPDQYDDLQAMIPDYCRVGVPREDGVGKGERALILYRPERFEQLDAGTFWLSETPEVTGSRSWNTACVRVCSWARLRDRQTGRVLLHANTHFDHESVEARRHSARLLKARLPQLAQGSAILLTGDFNCCEPDEPYTILTDTTGPSELVLHDSYRTLHPQRTDQENSCHGYTGSTQGLRIDWVLHSAQLRPTAAEIVRDRAADGRYPSDHFPVTTLFEWTEPSSSVRT